MSGRRAAVAIACALAAGAAFIAISIFAFGHTLDVLEYDQPLVVYNTTVGLVLVVWLFDVAWRATSLGQRTLVAVVIVAALVRSRIVFPIVEVHVPWSGHALFLAFALVTARSLWVRFAALAVIAQVLYVKVRFDDVSWVWGLAGGVAAGALFTRVLPRRGD